MLQLCSSVAALASKGGVGCGGRGLVSEGKGRKEEVWGQAWVKMGGGLQRVSEQILWEKGGD